MRRRHVLLPAALFLALAAGASAEPAASATPAPAPAGEAGPTYEALFSDIIQNLPERDRAKVDSARAQAAEPKAAAPAPPRSAGDPDAPGAGRREQALGKLPPEVKERVEKAIRNLENRQTDRMLEFKELEK